MISNQSSINRMKLPHIPILRFGEAYQSLDTLGVTDHRNEQVLADVSQANPGLIRRDLMRSLNSINAFAGLSQTRILEICKKAAELFISESLPLGGGTPTQSSEEYVQALSATSGLPHTLCRRNMEKIERVLKEMPRILGGLTRNLSAEIFDHFVTNESGLPLCYYPLTQALGVVLPSNSPGVNSLWLPAVGLRVPVAIKPGREEPWTPWRIIQALIAAGCPRKSFGFYPTSHNGAEAILDCCGRSMIFGDRRTVEVYANEPHIHVHGPGNSKILIGEDQIDRWPEFFDVLVESVAANSGRSCINASTIIVPSHGYEVTQALAERLIKVYPRPLDDTFAELSAFANPAVANSINTAINEDLTVDGGRDITAELRGRPRLVELGGSTFLHPTVVYCADVDHPLVNREYLFPFVSVVEVPQKEMIQRLGPSLVVTAVTNDNRFIRQLLLSPDIERLNIGPIPTTTVSWDQPHEGNLFEFIYQRRAIQCDDSVTKIGHQIT